MAISAFAGFCCPCISQRELMLVFVCEHSCILVPAAMSHVSALAGADVQSVFRAQPIVRSPRPPLRFVVPSAFTLWFGKTTNMSDVSPAFQFPDKFIMPGAPVERQAIHARRVVHAESDAEYQEA